MKYTKPEVTLIGRAREVIEFNQQGQKTSTNLDGGTPNLAPPAYDLDE